MDAPNILCVGFTDCGLGSGKESEEFLLVFISMTLLPLLMGLVPSVESFRNFLHDPEFVSSGFGFL